MGRWINGCNSSAHRSDRGPALTMRSLSSVDRHAIQAEASAGYLSFPVSCSPPYPCCALWDEELVRVKRNVGDRLVVAGCFVVVVGSLNFKTRTRTGGNVAKLRRPFGCPGCAPRNGVYLCAYYTTDYMLLMWRQQGKSVAK